MYFIRFRMIRAKHYIDEHFLTKDRVATARRPLSFMRSYYDRLAQ